MPAAPLGTRTSASRESVLHDNLRALARLGARGLEKAVADASDDGELDEANGEVTGVAVRTACGLVRLHGRRDQVGEARRLLPPGAIEAPLVVVIGAGAGFVVDGLEQQGCPGRVLVLEPSSASLKAMLSRRGWSALLEANRLRVLCGPDYAGWLDLWNWVGETAETPPLVVHPVLARQRPDDVRQAVEVLNRLLFNANANAAARRRFAGPYLLNTLSNLRHLVASRDVAELFGRFSGVPAYVLGAGPSLNRNLNELRPRRDGALVLAVDTALRPCLEVGVEPDLVVAVDPGEVNLRHLAIGAAPQRTHLVAEPSVAPGSFDAFGGRVFTFRVARHDPWPWLLEQGIDRATLLAWGSVLSTTLDLAVKLGCRPVVMLGADFAYTDGQPYCRGTAFEEDWAREVAAGTRIEDVWRRSMREPIVTERGIDGRVVETSAHLQAFRDWVVAFSEEHLEVEFVNATGTGLLSGGRVRQTLGRPERTSTALLCRRDQPSASVLVHGGPTAEGISASLRQQLISSPVEPFDTWPRAWTTVSSPSVDRVCLWKAAFDSAPDEVRREVLDLLRGWLNQSPNDLRLRGLWNSVHQSGGVPSAGPPAARWVPRGAEHAHGARARRELAMLAAASAASPAATADFHSDWYLQLNARRLEHLATLDLDVAGKTVLEVGAGIGDLTTFFVDRGCAVLTTDGRDENVERLRRRFAAHPLVEAERLVLDPAPVAPRGTFDVVFCYGLLYHLSDLTESLDYLTRCCEGILLVETVVQHDPTAGLTCQAKDARTATASLSGAWTLAPREWVHERLSERFPYVYVPGSQPSHYQFPVDWRGRVNAGARAIFVASRQPIENPALNRGLPLEQTRQ